jgi:hypothetical protein
MNHGYGLISLNSSNGKARRTRTRTMQRRTTDSESRVFHEPVGEDLDARVAERGGSELEVPELSPEDLRGHGHDVVDHVHGHRRQRHPQQQRQLQAGPWLKERVRRRVHGAPHG